MSYFEIIKEPLPFDKELFDKMYKLAGDALADADGGEYTQAVAVVTVSGREHISVIKNALSQENDDEKRLLEEMAADGDGMIHRILVMWKDGTVDIPSYRLRRLFAESDAANADAGIFVKTKDGYSVIKLGNTLN